MKIVFYGIAAVLGLLGIIFIAGSQGIIMRMVIGVILFIGAGGMIYLSRMQPQIQRTEITQKIDLSGNVSLQKLKCQACGGELTEKLLQVKAGAIFVECEYCGSTYQLEEDVKW
jgi:uncharacterized protein with PIN domain